MNVGSLRVEIVCPGASSLKEKRSRVRSIKERARHRFRVAAAEVEFQDLWQRAALGFAAVGADGAAVRRVLESVLDDLRRNPKVQLTRHEMETY